MIAVDTSALMAIVLNEKEADACIAALAMAKENSCRLLYVGDDFVKTDIASVL